MKSEVFLTLFPVLDMCYKACDSFKCPPSSSFRWEGCQSGKSFCWGLDFASTHFSLSLSSLLPTPYALLNTYLSLIHVLTQKIEKACISRDLCICQLGVVANEWTWQKLIFPKLEILDSIFPRRVHLWKVLGAWTLTRMSILLLTYERAAGTLPGEWGNSREVGSIWQLHNCQCETK